MNRRELLQAASYSVSCLALSAPIAPAFGFRKEPGEHDAELLTTALSRARLCGKPVLAIAVPEPAAERGSRSSLWGVLLNCASDELLATLALVEVVCVRSRTLQPLGAELDGEPLAFLIEQQSGPSVTSIRAQIGESPSARRAPLPTLADYAQWAEPLGLAVYRAIAGSVARVADLALHARVALDPATVAEAERDLRELAIAPSPRLERAAALYYLASLRNRGSTHAWFGGLAEIGAERLRTQAPPGARWNARVFGCVAGPCGTGYSPEPGRRFLSFLTAQN